MRKEDFPIYQRTMNELPLIYMDHAATSQKPRIVLETEKKFYETSNSNVRRGAHTLSQEATALYEGVREKVYGFLGLSKKDEYSVIFTKGCTESINLVSRSWGEKFVSSGDSILVTRMDHHANFVPWQMLAEKKQAHLLIAELNSEERLNLVEFEKLCKEKKPKVVSFPWMSNVLGVINPVKKMIDIAKSCGAITVLDAAQAVAHMPLKLDEIRDFDFLAFSSHKVFGPTGVGVLVGKNSVLETMDPFLFGGDMILDVSDDRTLLNELPWRFEAGTPNFAGVIGFGAALDYVSTVGFSEIEKVEKNLSEVLLSELLKIEGLRLLGPKNLQDRGSVFSFSIPGIHPHDLSTFLDQKGIAIRSGHHCAQPLGKKLGIPASTRISLSFTNTVEEIETVVSALQEAVQFFSRGKK